MLDFHASVVPLVLFLGGVISMKILDAGFSLFCCFIGSVSGKKAWRSGLCILVLHVCLFLDRRLVMCSVYFWRKGSEMRDVHFGAGPKVRVGWICWKGFGMGMLLKAWTAAPVN
jgi:hypothetical protein